MSRSIVAEIRLAAQGKVTGVEASKKTGVIVLVSIAAAGTGVAVAVAVAKWRAKHLGANRDASSLRGVQDVLSDCYRKIDEIERNLPEAAKAMTSHNNGTSSGFLFRALANGNPAMEGGV